MLINPTDWLCTPTKVLIFGNNAENLPVTVAIGDYLPRFTVQTRTLRSLEDYEDEIETWIRNNTKSWNPDSATKAWATNFRKAKTAWGYTGDEKFASFDIICKDLSQYRKLERKIRYQSENFPVPDAEVHDYMEPIEQLVHTQKICHHEWMNYDERQAQVFAIEKQPELEVRYCQLYFDFETFAHIPDSIESNRNHAEDCIFMASMCFVRRDKSEVSYLLHFTKEPLCESLSENQIPVHCRTERGLLESFIRIWKKEKPDFCYGFNSSTFDWPYFKARCDRFGVPFASLSRVPTVSPADLVEKKSETGNKGELQTWQLHCPGVNDIDLMAYVRDKLPKESYQNYQLNTVLKNELKEEKKDFAYWRVMQAFREQNPSELHQCAEYCYMDTKPLQRLAEKINAAVTLREEANVSLVPLRVLLQCGVSKVYEQLITKEAKDNNLTFPYRLQPKKVVVEGTRKRKQTIENARAAAKKLATDKTKAGIARLFGAQSVVLEDEVSDDEDDDDDDDTSSDAGNEVNLPLLQSCAETVYESVVRDDELYNEDDEKEDESYEGATVLDIIAGLYRYVVTGDFASLYPSIMLAYHIDYPSIVLDKKYEAHALANGGIHHTWQVKFFKRENDPIMFMTDTAAIDGILKTDLSYEMLKLQETATTKHCIEGATKMLSKTLISALKDPAAKKTKLALMQLRKRARTIFKSEFRMVLIDKSAIIVPKAACLLTSIESRFLRLRKEAKKTRDTYPESSYMYRLYEAKQLALKVVCNGLYGFTGGKVLPCKIIAELITSLGRKLIGKVKNAAETFKEYLIENDQISDGEKEALSFQVIGGDTDSVFVNVIGVDDKERCFVLGEKFTEWVTKDIIGNKHIKFEFEKLSSFNLEGRKKRSERLHYRKGGYKDSAKGNAFIRRQYCTALKTLMVQMRSMLFDKLEIETSQEIGERALTMLEKALRTISQNSVEDMAVSMKASSKNIKRTGAVKTLYQKMKERNERTLCIGERFSMLYVDRKGLPADKAETPEYANKHKLRPDPVHYVKHYKGPILEFLKATGRAHDAEKMFDHYERMYTNKAKGQGQLCFGKEKQEMPFYRY